MSFPPDEELPPPPNDPSEGGAWFEAPPPVQAPPLVQATPQPSGGYRSRTATPPIAAPEPTKGVVIDFKAAQEPTPPAPPPAYDRATTRDANLSLIHVNRLEPFMLVSSAWDAIFESNKTPWLFRRGVVMSIIGETETGAPCLYPCGTSEVSAFLLRVARWVKVGEKSMTPTEPPRFVASDMVAIPSTKLPSIEGIIRSPVFDASDGKTRLVNTPGYDKSSKLYFVPPKDIAAPFVPDKPTTAQVENAKQLIFGEWLGDFPFETTADRTHTLAIMLLPLVRRLFSGPTPLHLIEAAERGTGKSLLAKIITAPCMNGITEATTLSTEPEEVRKKITSLLMASRQVICWDNLSGIVDSADLAAVLTNTMWEDRALSLNRIVTVPNYVTWLATGNNAEFSTDIARRSLRIRLNRNMERPWEWTGAKIKDLEEWTMMNRRQLLGAALTLVQSWVAAGRPMAKYHLGSFEGWAKTMGSILDHVGMPGFISNLDQMYEQADQTMVEWRGFVLEWWNQWGPATCTSGRLATMANECGLLMSVIGAAQNERSHAIKVGRALARNRDRVVSGLRVVLRTEHNQTVYALEAVGDDAPPRAIPTPKARPWSRGEED